MPDLPDGDDAFASALDSIRQALAEDKQAGQGVVDILHDAFAHYSWVGVYIVSSGDLVLGPWRGPQATEHTRIPIGEGICGAAAASGVTEIVDDVNTDSRYLACFASTRSEIVVPIHRDGRVIGEIDIDSDRPGALRAADQAFLEQVAAMLALSIA
jgi:L-methionine (R)-S-oxide reductase